MNESKIKKVFQFELTCDKHVFHLDSSLIFTIKHAWVESGWSYECNNNRPVVKKDDFYQLVIESDSSFPTDSLIYLLEGSGSYGCYLGGQLSFNYAGGDTAQLVLKNSKTNTIVDTLRFRRK